MSKVFLFVKARIPPSTSAGNVLGGFKKGIFGQAAEGHAYSTNKMASDEDYASFLDKANQDPSEGVETGGMGGKLEFRATQMGVQVPRCILDVVGGEGAWYTSDADERFEGVALKAEGKGLPTEGLFPIFPSLVLQREKVFVTEGDG